MLAQAVFGLSIAFGFVVWTIVALQYVWPPLRDRPRPDALRPLLLQPAPRCSSGALQPGRGGTDDPSNSPPAAGSLSFGSPVHEIRLDGLEAGVLFP
jgi:hypothetical protein